MIRVYSSGGIVLQEHQGGTCLLLVRKRDSGAWTLPKGHLDTGESEEQTAVREVREETGYAVVVNEKVGEICFTYMKNGQHFEEVASFFLMEPLRAGAREATEEIGDVQWFPIDEALDLMSYENEKNLVRLALKSWKSRNNLVGKRAGNALQ